MAPLLELAGKVEILELGWLTLAAVLVAAFATRPTDAQGWTMTPSFVIDFAALILLGPVAAMVVAVAGIVTAELTDSRRASSPLRMLLGAAIAITSIETAALAHGVLGGTTGNLAWPWQGVPIAVAVVAYCLVKSAAAEIVVPFCTKQPVNRSWPQSLLRGCPAYIIGASLAVGLVEVIDHRMWEVLPVAALPLFLVYRAYSAGLKNAGRQGRREDVLESLDQALCVVDGQGRITLWNAALERMLDCARDQALNRAIAVAVPDLGKSELPRAISDALTIRTARTITHLEVPFDSGPKILQVRISPLAGGATLLWQDITVQSHEDAALRRSAERLVLAAEGANDGLWEWDLRSEEFFFSGRWRAMLGLPAVPGTGGLKDWMERVHADDLVTLRDALEAHLSGRTEHFQHEHRIRHEDGTYRRFLCRGVAARVGTRRPARIAGSLTDLTERPIAQEGLSSAEFRDPLTGLSNRAVFVDGLGRRLEELKKRGGRSRFAALYLDLDRFKVVNDSLGHMVGDQLLAVVSRRLEACLRPGDALARLGGDEFAILLNDLDDETQANAISFRIQKALSAPCSIGGKEVFTTASIGIAFGRPQYNNPEEIMRDADTAMYHAKSRGKARHELFDADMHAREQDRLGLENDLRHAVDHNDFEVHYQPIVSLTSGMCVGFESLIRWTRNGQSVSPAVFIPIAEELGLVEPLGTWVLQQACTAFADWKRRFPAQGLDCITVNVSSRQLMQQNFLWVVQQAVRNSGLKPRDLRLEITETALMDSPTVAADLLKRLREYGVKIYLDDFGTGYSSLSHLHKLPVDALKIDRSFVKSLLLPDRPAIVESIMALARTLNTSVVAEGIEDDVQATELERLGCTHAQGYLFSRPLSVRSVEEILVASVPLGPKNVGPALDWAKDLQRIVSLSR